MNTEELRIYLRTVSDTRGVKETQQSLRGIGKEALALGAAIGIGIPSATAAVQSVASALGDSINVLREHQRVARATAAAYGTLSTEWTRFADALAEQTGFTSDAILTAALSARTLSANYKLSTAQTQELIKASADLARVRGIGVAESFERVQSAIRGEAEAAEYLGLTLNDTFIKNNAMNGSVRDTFEKMTDAQKAQIRYNELLRQTAAFAGLAASGMNNLDGAFARAGKSGYDLQITLGRIIAPSVMQGMNFLTGAMKLLKQNFDDAIDAGDRLVRSPVFQFLRQLPGVEATVLPLASAAEAKRQEERDQDRLRALKQQQQAMRRLQELNELPTRTAADDLKRIALWDQADAAVRDATAALDRQVELQREGVNLAAQEAQLRLSMLPAQQEMAELQRKMTEQQIRARQAALPAAEALEDLRFAQQRAELISRNRNVGVEQRIAARRELRGIGRALPGAELAALEAGRPVTLAERAATRLGMEQQLFEISTQRQLQQIEQAQTTNAWLSQIASQQTQAIELTINLGTEEFQTEVFKQLVEAEKQAQGPTVVKLSGVRR